MSVFLSHNHADKDFVRRIGLRLQRRGVDVWIDEAEIRPGDSLIEKISEGLGGCEYVLAFLSNNSVNAPWVKKELSIAITREIKGKLYNVIPVVLDDVSVPIWLEDKLYIDFSDENDFQINFDRLLVGLGVEKHFDVREDTLDLLDFHAAIVTTDYVVAFASALSAEDDYVFRDPDGTKFPLKDFYLVRASAAGLESQRFTQQRLGHGCILESDKHFVVFANFRPRQGTYEMCGFKWLLRKSDLGVQKVDTIFENNNWGWFPVIDSKLDISHFSFDEYFRCLNGEKNERVEPSTMEKEHVNFLSAVSSGEIPNSSAHVANVIRRYLA